jgi:CheY-like chemotaxis protein/Tfp pilus assembly protein PilF
MKTMDNCSPGSFDKRYPGFFIRPGQSLRQQNKVIKNMSGNKQLIDLENMSILVVDDMKSMRLTIRKMLRNLDIGKRLLFAEDGQKGLDILLESEIDLAIIDWNMPVMNGIQLLSYIRKTKSLRDLPAIMLTAEAEKDIVYEVAEIEIDAYLLKPLTLESLDNKIRTVVHRANHPSEANIHRNKSRDYEEEGDFKSAIQQIKLALNSKPSASRLLRELGLLYEKDGKSQIAVKCLQKAASVNPQDATTRYILGEMHRKTGDLETAAKYYFEVMSLTSKYTDQAIDLGKRLFNKGLPDRAIEIFKGVISTAKKQVYTKELIADICIEHDEFEYSKILLDSIIKEVPSKYDTVYKAGVVYQTIGDSDKALGYFKTVDKHQSSRIDVKLQIAKIYFDKNKILQADDYLNTVLRKDPDNSEALEMRKSM